MKKAIVFLTCSDDSITRTIESKMFSEGDSVSELRKALLQAVWKNESEISPGVQGAKRFTISVGGISELEIPVRSQSYQYFNDFMEATERLDVSLRILIDTEGTDIAKFELTDHAKEALLKRWITSIGWSGSYRVRSINSHKVETFLNMQAVERFISDQNAAVEKDIIQYYRQPLARDYLKAATKDLILVNHMLDTDGMVSVTLL